MIWRIHANFGQNHGTLVNTKNSPACRRLLWILLVRSCTVCFSLSLSQLVIIFFSSSSFLPLCWAQLMVVSSFYVVFAICLLCRFLHPILDPLVFAPNTFTRINFLWPFQNPGLNLNRGLNKAIFLRQTVFYTKRSFPQKHTKTVIYTKTVFCTKTMFLLPPVQAFVATCRIAIPMVPGGTRRRRSIS